MSVTTPTARIPPETGRFAASNAVRPPPRPISRPGTTRLAASTPKMRTAMRNVSQSNGPSRRAAALNAEPMSGVMRP